MNGIIFCVCSAISVPPIVLKRCRKEHKKMQVKKESQQNQRRCWIWSHDTAWGIRTCLPRLHRKARRKPDLKVRKYLWSRGMISNQERWDLWWAPAHQTTLNGTLRSGLLKSGNPVKCWEQARGETSGWQVCHRWWYGLWHRHRIGLLSQITFILEQSEWPIAKDAEPFSRRFNARHWETFYEVVNFLVFDSGRICILWKELLRQLTFHEKYRRMYYFEEDVRDIWTVDIGTFGWDFWSNSN